MIETKADLNAYIAADALACGRSSRRPRLIGDDVWRFQLSLRKHEYWHNRKAKAGALEKLLILPALAYRKMEFARRSARLNYTIPLNVFDRGLSIAHPGAIVVNASARVGKNCRIHECVTIGSTNGCKQSAVIGDNVFLASGARIIGDISIADDVAIGANAVVIRSITEPGTTWAGVPARMVSRKDSHSNLNPRLFE